MEMRRTGVQPGGRDNVAGASLRELFHEVAGMPAEERSRIFAERRVPPDLRVEVESLLRYDSSGGPFLTRRVHQVAEQALLWDGGSVPRCCGPYRLLGPLGAGGMGAVYLAERCDGEIEQRVAVKFLRADADCPEWRAHFLRERQLLAYLNHSSIARLLDAGHTVDGRPYLVMEYVDGTPIDEYAAPLDLRARLRLFLQVCEGVSHAHRHLVVHRDLKPSNILVDASGQPKLLDFGIAKLLEVGADETRAVERLLTPSYASPEQLRGDVQTTATDVYSLGAVLHKLLAGHPPREVLPLAHEPFRQLPPDVGHILRKALRHEPGLRYASVDAFAADVRAFLESRPVEARSRDACYRVRKFLWRNRAAAAAAVITAAGLLLGAQMANRERRVARARVMQVRQLANKILSLEEVSSGLHNSSKAMHEVVELSKEHLETLLAKARRDQDLALEVVEAYSLLARAQGICMASHPGQRARAEESLRKAAAFVEPILKARPDHRKALLTAARISHDRMVLTENERRSREAVREARSAAAYLDRLVELGPLSAAESDTASELFYNIALSHKNQRLPVDGIRYARRSIEVSQSSPNASMRQSLALSMLADLLRYTGDLEGALQAVREARTRLETARFSNDRERLSAWCAVLGREGRILYVPGGISLDRPGEALPVYQEAFDLLEQWTRADRNDAWTRLLFVTVGRALGDTARLRSPQRALAVYDHALSRIREVRDHPEALRGEAEMLAASSYALRRLNRAAEAKSRIDLAFRLLAETKDYPAGRIPLHEAADFALRALGDHLLAAGHPRRAADVYETLLAGILATQPDPLHDLPQAVGLSGIYGTLEDLHRRAGQQHRAEALFRQRLELWRHWHGKSPDNPFISARLRRFPGEKARQFLPAFALHEVREDEIRETHDHQSGLAPAGRRHGNGASLHSGSGANVLGGKREGTGGDPGAGGQQGLS
ncbi:MAG: protein kinase [Bryobacterales bacterium]|nr:protein kinase [Bryobacterales bacterium]